MTNPYYNHFQPNKKKTGDCTVRALCKGMDLTWEQAYDLLAEAGRKLKVMPDSTEAMDSVLKNFSWDNVHVQPVKGGKRWTVNEWCKEHAQGTYIASVSQHMVCMKDGQFHDIWDCGNKSIYKLWRKK